MPEIIIITAVYENGVLRPVNPVPLSEGQTVRIQIVPEVSPEETKKELDKAFQSMVDQGMMRLPTKQRPVDPAYEEARRQRFEKMKGRAGKPLSEIIIEDRGPW